jgi:hypothetical protein
MLITSPAAPLLLFLLAAVAMGCAQTAPSDPAASVDVQTIPGGKFLPLPTVERALPSREKQALAAEIDGLNTTIGGYPPKFDSDAHRARTYHLWSDLLADARAYQTAEGRSERSYFYLAELYRQGHNMDVLGSAGEAEKNIEACIAAFPESKPCHFSAIYYYLSISPDFVSRAERSLTFLRAALAPKIDLNVERHFIILYLYQQRLPEAVAQMNYYLSQFPDAPDRKQWEMVTKAAAEGTLEFKHTYE